jgi:hypothetical protein
VDLCIAAYKVIPYSNPQHLFVNQFFRLIRIPEMSSRAKQKLKRIGKQRLDLEQTK